MGVEVSFGKSECLGIETFKCIILVATSTLFPSQIGINGIISFDQPYGSFSNQAFPGNFFISSRYLVAPFWDDANIVGGRGQISYEIHDSGFLLEHISAFIRSQRPSEFQGTWMLIVFYDVVQPYFGSAVRNISMPC